MSFVIGLNVRISERIFGKGRGDLSLDELIPVDWVFDWNSVFIDYVAQRFRGDFSLDD